MREDISSDSTMDERLEHLRPYALCVAGKYERQYRLPTGELHATALLGAWQAAQRWNGTGSLKGWAATRIHGACLDEIRNLYNIAGGSRLEHLRIMEIPAGLGQESAYSLSGDTEHSDVLLFAMTQTDSRTGGCEDSGYVTLDHQCELDWALAKIPHRLAELLIRLFYYEDTAADIAREWGLSEGRITQLKHEALSQVRVVFGLETQRKIKAEPRKRPTGVAQPALIGLPAGLPAAKSGTSRRTHRPPSRTMTSEPLIGLPDVCA